MKGLTIRNTKTNFLILFAIILGCIIYGIIAFSYYMFIEVTFLPGKLWIRSLLYIALFGIGTTAISKVWDILTELFKRAKGR